MATAHGGKRPHLGSLEDALKETPPAPKKPAKAKYAKASKTKNAVKATVPRMPGAKLHGKKPTQKKPSRPAARPLEDAQIGQIAGVPDGAQITQALATLSDEDKAVARRIRELLAKHLGSHAAARLWLATRSPGFESTPLDAIRQGQAKTVLATLESQWGRNPIYA